MAARRSLSEPACAGDGAAHREADASPGARALRADIAALEDFKDALRKPGSTPGPRSRTASSASGPARCTSSSTGASAALYLRALSTRLSSSWGDEQSIAPEQLQAGLDMRVHAGTFRPATDAAQGRCRRSPRPTPSRSAVVCRVRPDARAAGCCPSDGRGARPLRRCPGPVAGAGPG